MDLMFENLEPALIRSLLASVDVVPPDDMQESDKEVFRVISRMLMALIITPSDETVVALWKRAFADEREVSNQSNNGGVQA